MLTTGLRPRRRGDLRAVGVTVRIPGPLGLAARQATLDVPGAVRSLPPFESRKHLPSRLARLRELDGRSAVRIRGAGTEFDSLREYVRGDDVRSIDWRASARNRNVVVRTWQPERDRRVVIVLDTSRVSAARIGDVPRLDSAMDAALLLAALAARAGDRIDFLAGDRQVRARVRAAGARDIVATLQDTMADLEPVIAEADWADLAGAVNHLGRQRALVVLLTPLEPASVIESLLPVLPALLKHHRVVVASVQDPALGELRERRESLSEVYAAAAAAQVLQQRRRASEILDRARRRRGGCRGRAAAAGAGRPLPRAEGARPALTHAGPGLRLEDDLAVRPPLLEVAVGVGGVRQGVARPHHRDAGAVRGGRQGVLLERAQAARTGEQAWAEWRVDDDVVGPGGLSARGPAERQHPATRDQESGGGLGDLATDAVEQHCRAAHGVAHLLRPRRVEVVDRVRGPR